MKNWEKVLIEPDASIFEAVKTIDKSGCLLTAIVVNEKRQLLGTVTDGDIRRGMLKFIPMDASVREIMNQQPVTLNIESSNLEVRKTLRENPSCRIIPILDEDYKIVGIKKQGKKYSKKFDNPVVLMAGGLGTRLRPLTDEIPKPLLTVGDKPILETIIDSFASNGFSNFFISVNYKAEMIEDYFGDGSEKGISIKYLKEDKRLGTAGALSLMNDYPAELPMIVMNGDLLTKVNFQKLLEFHNLNKFSATMCVREHQLEVPFGVADIDECRLEALVEKPVKRMFVNAGIYMLNPEIVNMVPKDTFYDMPDLFSSLLEDGDKPGVFPINEYWLDIGRMSEYKKADKAYATMISS